MSVLEMGNGLVIKVTVVYKNFSHFLDLDPIQRKRGLDSVNLLKF